MQRAADIPLAPLATAPPAGAAQRAGVMAGLAAYLMWGFIPLFFKLVAHVPPAVVLSHRIIWSVVFLAAVLTAQRRWADVVAALRLRQTMLALACSTTMIAINWFVFLWAISYRQVAQASLGYFINPLVAVLLGMIFLRERLRAAQAAALLLATAGVLVQVIAFGKFPWVAVSLAVSFAFYALLRKTAPVGPLVGLFVETTILLPVAAWFVERHSGQAGGEAVFSPRTYSVLMTSGVITAIPLLLFATAARRLTMATLGFMQFIAPTCQLLLAVLAFGEPFTRWHGVSFGLIWVALGLYSLTTFGRRNPSPAAPPPQEIPAEPAAARVINCAEV